MKLFIALLAIFLTGSLQAQEINAVMLDTTINEMILIGECNRDGLLKPEFAGFDPTYNMYNPDTMILNQLSRKAKDYRINIFLGSWCSDSQEQVPRFIKIADLAGISPDQISIWCLDRKKHCGAISDLIVQSAIEKVPTFIFYQGENEIGRITETPIESLESDWLKILENGQK